MAKKLIIIAETTRYPLEAFAFVQRGLEYTVAKQQEALTHQADSLQDEEDLSIEDPMLGKLVSDEDGQEVKPAIRHVTGQALCEGLRCYAIEQYGLLARTVLRRWKITSCQDFGRIVFAMVDAGLMSKTAEDSLSDFDNVFDFAEAFGAKLTLKGVKA